MIQGCTGGTFITHDMAGLHEWVDFEGPYMLVNFDRRPFSFDLSSRWDDKYNDYISRREHSREEWWTWNDYLPSTHVSRPPWWNSMTKDDAKVRLLLWMLL